MCNNSVSDYVMTKEKYSIPDVYFYGQGSSKQLENMALRISKKI